MTGSLLIETGVDKLVSLVRKKKKVSVAEAAKQLGVSTIVVEEWADFLEDEGIISLEYKFTTPYLVERLLSKEEIIKKEKEFSGKKEAFIRKAEVALALLDNEGEKFQSIRDQFDGLKKDFAVEIKNVKGDLKELERYEELKNNIDIQISEQERQFKQKIEQIEGQIAREEKKYADVLVKIVQEQKQLDKERLIALSIRERENLLRKKLEDFKRMIENIENALESEDEIITDSEEHIAHLKEIVDGIHDSVKSRKDALDDLFAQSKNYEQKITKVQEAILAKAKAKKQEIDERIAQGRGASKKFSMFFEKKAKIEDILKKISDKRNELEDAITHIIHKAKAFSIAARSKGIAAHITELKSTFKHIEKKKTAFEKEIRKLSSLIKS